jgi:hypothetical protein
MKYFVGYCMIQCVHILITNFIILSNVYFRNKRCLSYRWWYKIPLYGLALALKDIKENRYFRKTIKWGEV